MLSSLEKGEGGPVECRFKMLFEANIANLRTVLC